MKMFSLIYLVISLSINNLMADSNPIVEAINDTKKSVEEIKEIIERNQEKINATDERWYMTPITQALNLSTKDEKKKKEIIKLILTYKPTMDANDIYYASADDEVLDWVLFNNDINMKARNSGRTALFMAIDGSSNNLLKVKNLLDRGADVDVIDISGDTPLISAILSLSRQKQEKVSDVAKIIKLLLEKKNNSNTKNKNGQTALSLALNKFSEDSSNNRYYEVFDELFGFLSHDEALNLIKTLDGKGKTQSSKRYADILAEKEKAVALIRTNFIQLDIELGLLSQRLKKG